MNIFYKLLSVASAAFFIASAQAQNAGTVTSHAFAIGKGAGTTGYTSLLCGSAQLAVGQSAADPICKTITGDWTLSAAGAATLATVNANVGSFGSATNCPAFTVNAKGLITAASATTCTPAIGSVTGLATGVATFLATPSSANLRAALTDEVGTGAAYFVGGALGTPASGTATNLTGLPPSGLTAQNAFTFLGNNTSGSASPTAVDIATLTAKASPASTDLVIISDQAASGAWKKASVSSLASAGSVSSIAGNTGAFTLNATTGLTNSTNDIQCQQGSSSQFGCVKVDGTSLTASSGILSFSAASKAQQQTGTSATAAVTPSHQQDHDSSPKAVCQFSGTTTGTNACAFFSYNVTSVTRNVAGQYTLNFTTAFASANFGCIAMMNNSANNAFAQGLSANTTTTYKFATVNLSGVSIDEPDITVTCWGRQ